jgi:hypothetical protein
MTTPPVKVGTLAESHDEDDSDAEEVELEEEVLKAVDRDE